jgi:hypothetical protein
MDGVPSGLGLAAIARYADAWKALHARISHRFARAEARDRAGRHQAAGEGLATGVAHLAGSRTASTTCRMASMTSTGCSA